jgi:hypothetical protein
MQDSKPVKGFVYVAGKSESPLLHAKIGSCVRIKGRRPPWIVVDHTLESVIVASQWPGRLLQVAVVDAVTEEDSLAAGAGKLTLNVGYTTALAVRVLDELPTARLFGENGEAVCSVIDQAGKLELNQVSLLANARHPDAGKFYTRAWNNWLAQVDQNSEHRGKDHNGVLAIVLNTKGANSPINYGFSVIYVEITKCARKIGGPSAFGVDEDGEQYLDPVWAAASNSLVEAAMAFGAPELLGKKGRGVLAAAWRRVFGNDPH